MTDGEAIRVFQNPIIPGFHPDPSICRVDDDYYLVNSSFAYFPGVPVFHSRDLVHWRQIGHCLTRSEQLPLGHAGVSGGIFAPTIRYHDGIFYMVTTNISGGGNFYVTTRDPAGEWSDPIWVNQPGIDPSLLFDNGHVYFTSTGILETSETSEKVQGILQSEIDIQTGHLLSTPRLIWRGTGGAYPEGPHLYAINGKFYLMIAEGGTEFAHCEVITRSDTPWGPWENCPTNPILTHRGIASPFQALGHADLVKAQDGSWWLVCLGFRPNFPQAHHLGRETFLAPVVWDEHGWPQVGNGGRIEPQMTAPLLPPVTWPGEVGPDHFDALELGLKWNFLGAPADGAWSLSLRPGYLCLQAGKASLDDGLGVTFLGCRQEHFNCEVVTSVDYSPDADGEEAGITVWMDNRHHYDFFVTLLDGRRQACVRRRIGSLSAVVARLDLPAGAVTFCIRANRLFYAFILVDDLDNEHILATGETRYLSSEVAGGFTGVYFGLYASRSGLEEVNPAFFDWFDYRDQDHDDFLGLDSPISELLQNEQAKAILAQFLPELVAHPPGEWGANLSIPGMAGMAPEAMTPEKLLGIAASLRRAGIPMHQG